MVIHPLHVGLQTLRIGPSGEHGKGGDMGFFATIKGYWCWFWDRVIDFFTGRLSRSSMHSSCLTISLFALINFSESWSMQGQMLEFFRLELPFQVPMDRLDANGRVASCCSIRRCVRLPPTAALQCTSRD
jgi:hypothetical protein